MLLDEVILQMHDLCEQYSDKVIMIGGDFNVDLVDMGAGARDECVRHILKFVSDCNLRSTFDLYPGRKFISYFSQSCGSQSLLDYFFTTAFSSIVEVAVLDLANNFSDHCPVLSKIIIAGPSVGISGERVANDVAASWLRWDRADLGMYYGDTRMRLEPIYMRLLMCDNATVGMSVDEIYNCAE